MLQIGLVVLALMGCSKSYKGEINTSDGSGSTGQVDQKPQTGKDYGVQNGYPSHWWDEVTSGDIPKWEITPDQARPGEVILSKRNELGLLSNFAATPIVFRGKTYASLEGFWQATKYPEVADDPRLDPRVTWRFTRKEVEQMVGKDAKDAGTLASENLKTLGIPWVTFEKLLMTYREAGNSAFYKLIRSVMIAKLLQNGEVREVLVKTKDLRLRPDHSHKPDDQKAWYYEVIWEELRAKAKKGEL